jgi:hypothetical protein
MSASCPGHQMVGLRRHGGLTAHGARRCAPVPQVHRYTRRLSFCRCTAAGAARRHAGQPAVAGGSHGALPPPQLADRQAKPPWQAPQRRCARCRCGKSLEMHGAGSTHTLHTLAPPRCSSHWPREPAQTAAAMVIRALAGAGARGRRGRRARARAVSGNKHSGGLSEGYRAGPAPALRCLAPPPASQRPARHPNAYIHG